MPNERGFPPFNSGFCVGKHAKTPRIRGSLNSYNGSIKQGIITFFIDVIEAAADPAEIDRNCNNCIIFR